MPQPTYNAFTRKGREAQVHTNYLFLWSFQSLPRISLLISPPSTWEEVEKGERKIIPNAGGGMVDSRVLEIVSSFGPL